MIFIWVVGVEGSGHHMIFNALFHKFKTKKNFLFESNGKGPLVDLHNSFSKLFESESSSNEKLEAKNNIHRLLSKYRDISSKEELILFDRNSHPYSNPRDTLRRWDIIDFVNIVKEYSTPRLLILLRNPINATYSCIRREMTDNVYLQSKIIEDNFICINNQIQTIDDKSIYRILDYDHFFHDPKFFIKCLSDWLKIKEDDLDGINLLRKPRTENDIPTAIRKPLKNFFTDQRTSQWRWLYKCGNNFSNFFDG
tara:strand:+ start:48470 stop:49228 length:759 start_codon:yes stop_codon:yes gene_type:complete